jgi:ferrous-iron efflux pump FieF
MAKGKTLPVSAMAERVGAAQPGPLMRRAALASVVTSLFLVVIKAVAYFASGSVSVLAALADSALDLFTSSLNLIAIRSALMPADAEHRFGHGKAEPLAGLGQGAFIAGSALFLVIQAAIRLVSPQPIEHAATAFTVMAISIVCAGGLVAYQRRVVALTGSVAISADRLHYLGDLFTNLGVLVAISLVWETGWTRADPIIALIVAGFMVASAWTVSRRSYDQLMDRELPDVDRERIKNIVMRHAEVRSLHDLRTRAAGVDTFIQVHIELDPAMSLMRAHEVSDAVEHELCDAFPRAEVIIHQDPAGVEIPAKLAQT